MNGISLNWNRSTGATVHVFTIHVACIMYAGVDVKERCGVRTPTTRTSRQSNGETGSSYAITRTTARDPVLLCSSSTVVRIYYAVGPPYQRTCHAPNYRRFVPKVLLFFFFVRNEIRSRDAVVIGSSGFNGKSRAIRITIGETVEPITKKR